MKRKLANYKHFLMDSLWNPAQSEDATRSRPKSFSVFSVSPDEANQSLAFEALVLSQPSPANVVTTSSRRSLEVRHLFSEEGLWLGLWPCALQCSISMRRGGSALPWQAGLSLVTVDTFPAAACMPPHRDGTWMPAAAVVPAASPMELWEPCGEQYRLFWRCHSAAVQDCVHPKVHQLPAFGAVQFRC